MDARNKAFVCVFFPIIKKVKYVLEISYEEAPGKCFKINKAEFISTCSYIRKQLRMC